MRCVAKDNKSGLGAADLKSVGVTFQFPIRDLLLVLVPLLPLELEKLLAKSIA